MVVALRFAARPGPVRAGTSPLAELMACLHVLAEPEHHHEAHAWVQRTAAAMPDSLRSELYRFSPLWARYRARVLFPIDCLDRSLDEELAALLTLPLDVFLPFVVDAITGRSSGRDAALENASSDHWVRECERRSFTRGDLAYSLVHQPARLRDDLVSALHDCQAAFFRQEWQHAQPALDASAREVTRRLQDQSVLDVVESLSDMASRRTSSDTVYFDKLQHGDTAVDAHGLLLVPSVRARPHVILKLDEGVPKVMHYLVRSPGAGVAASQSLLRRRLLVLSEPARWELCRHLIGEPITTTELTVRMGVSKYAVSRHLRVLREADLITSQKEGRQVFHRLNARIILALGPEVLEGILR